MSVATVEEVEGTLGYGLMGFGTIGASVYPRPALVWVFTDEVGLRVDTLEVGVVTDVVDHAVIQADVEEQVVVSLSEVEAI